MTAKTISIEGKIINKSLDVVLDKIFKLDNFSWVSCPIVVGFDTEYLQLLNFPIWENPRFKPVQRGETSVKVFLFEVDVNDPPVKVSEYNYNIIIRSDA